MCFQCLPEKGLLRERMNKKAGEWELKSIQPYKARYYPRVFPSRDSEVVPFVIIIERK